MPGYSPDKTYALFGSPSNLKTIGQLSKSRIETIVFPDIVTRSVPFGESDLQSFTGSEWVVFTDVYTVEYTIDTLTALHFDIYALDDLRVLAYGQAVADRLRLSQIHADVIPLTVRNSDILGSLNDYLIADSGFEAVEFLVLKERNAEIELVKSLKELKSFVTELGVYSSEVRHDVALPKFKALLRGGAIDEFIFSSHFDVLSFAQLFQTEDLDDLLHGIKITAADNLTLQSLREFRLIDK